MSILVDMVTELKATSKTNEKQEIIKQYHKYDADLVEMFFLLTLNPYYLYGKKSLTHDYTASMKPFEDLLEELSHAIMNDDRVEMKNIITEMESTSGDTFFLCNLVISKDLDCGVGASLVNKALGTKLIPEYKVGKAEEQTKLEKLTPPFYGNEKIDGGRATFTQFPDGSYELLSSGGNVIRQMGAKMLLELQLLANNIIQEFGLENGLQFDGEFLIVENGTRWTRQKSNGILNKMIKGSASEQDVNNMKFFVFDVLPDADSIKNGGTHVPLKRRVDMLNSTVTDFETIELVEYRVLKDFVEMKQMMDDILDQGGEGIIVKTFDGPYQTKRQPHWVKLKREVDIDVVVTGWTPHKKRSDMIGALCISSSCGTITGNIGTGHFLTEENRIMLKTMVDNDELDGIILDCCVHEITKDKNDKYSFYLPRITQIRYDKAEADDFEKIMSMF